MAWSTQAVLFYGSNLRVDDLPDFKTSRIMWGLLHEESPRNNPILVHEDALRLFNYAATFSRFSDVPLTLLDLPSAEDLTGKRYFKTTKEKTALMEKHNLAPLLYIQSDCNTASNRDLYVKELMQYIKVDSYGTCLNNAKLDHKLKDNYLESLTSDEFMSFVSYYKFTIAFENAVCDDYITEKLWRPLIVGSVPIYYGSPSFKDWLPTNKSAISVLDFSTPQQLSAFLHSLLSNDTAYEEYLTHKLFPQARITNKRLLESLNNRAKGAVYDFGHYVDQFECFVCDNLPSGDFDKGKIVEKKEYNCPVPINPISRRLDASNWWTEQWLVEKCGAKLLNYYVTNNISVSEQSFERTRYNMYERSEC